MDRDALLKQITILDFMATDLQLYLNTHPSDAEALRMYNDVILNAEKTRKEYEHLHGPLVSYRSTGGAAWKWIDCPWPWQANFNFDFSQYGEERL